MRAMPFLVAAPEAIQFQEPRVQLGEITHVAGDPVPTWDYMAPMTILSSATIIEKALRESTGLASPDMLSATLQVDCPATGYRHVVKTPLSSAQSQYPLELEIGPHLVASALEVRLGLVLNRSIDPVGLAAHRKGSRIHTDPHVYRFVLEGQGGGFPTEAFDFEKAGYPPGAAWRLNIKGDALDLPFNGAVRLLINTGHPQASRLLSGKPGVVQSVLFHGVLEHMLLATAEHSTPEETGGYDEGTLGSVLDELTRLYLGMPLSSTLRALATDRSRLLAKLQEATQFMNAEIL